MKWLISLSLLCLALPTYAETITSVHDGDSFHVAEFKKEVRVWGIDAPEIAPPPGTRGPHQGQPLAKESRDYLRSLILGKTVKLDCSHKRSHKVISSIRSVTVFR